jgi:hypothetical protein
MCDLRLGDLAIWRFEIGDLAISDWGIIDDSGAQIPQYNPNSTIAIVNSNHQSSISISSLNRQSSISIVNQQSQKSAIGSPQSAI